MAGSAIERIRERQKGVSGCVSRATSMTHWFNASNWLPIAVFSSLAGVKLVRKVPAERYYVIVYWLMVVAGIKLLLDGLGVS